MRETVSAGRLGGRYLRHANPARTACFARSGLSVLDVHCKAHELDNLYLVDTSFFASIGAVDPSLTVMASALRVGEHILGRLG